jgi:hypothetical protein
MIDCVVVVMDILCHEVSCPADGIVVVRVERRLGE